MIVVDAPLVLELLLGGDTAEEAAAVVAEYPRGLAAPHLLDVEVAGVLQHVKRRGVIDDARLWDALDDLADLPLTRHEHLPLLGRALQLCEHAGLADGLYLALAERLRAGLVTTDPVLAEVPGVRAEVRVLGAGH